MCSGRDVPDIALQRGKENYKYTFISEEINALITFWNINKLTRLCSETLFSNNSYQTETSQMICNAKQLASFQTDHIFSKRYFHINQFAANIPFKQTR